MLHVALRMPRDRDPRGRRRRRGGRGPRRARPHGRVRRAGPLRRVDRPHRQADPQRRQRRHRRVRPRAGDGLRGAAALQRPRPRRSGSCPTSTPPTSWRPPATSTRPRRCSSSRPRPSATLETMTNAHSARDWVAGRARRRRRGGPALRRGVHQRRAGGRVRHRHRQHVRLLGLGRRPLLDGLRHRPVHHDRDRPRPLRARCWPASTTMDEHFRTAPLRREPAGAHGPARGLVPQLLRTPRPSA